MEQEKVSLKAITPRTTDYSQWYLDVMSAADLFDYSPVKGCMVIKPYGYQLWEKVQNILDAKFKDIGVNNAYFPMLIPEKLLTREKDHVEGFAPEVAVVTHAGNEKLEEPLVLRPTSETIIYEMYKDWVRSYRDLPLLINQWANVIRWEKRTRPFLRTTEFLWQEGHTVHATNTEADEFAKKMLNIYADFLKDYMAIPVVQGVKSESEKFAGALYTYTCEAMMQDGKALQICTSHNLGDHFAKAFDIKYTDEQGASQYAWQTSWGISTRSIGGLIMSHSDDKGLVLPPNMATLKVVMVPIVNPETKQGVEEKATEIALEIQKEFGARAVHVDTRDTRPGEKYFEWEKKGVPIRLEIGPKDIANGQCVLVRRDTGEKIITEINNVVSSIKETLQNIQSSLYANALDRQNANTVEANTWDEFVSAIEAGKFVLAHYDGSVETEKLIKTETSATVRCIPFNEKPSNGICIKTGSPSVQRVIFAKNY
ncbi:MAG: proline--tRNA ligase [Minisyncoccia bacterium]